VRRCLLTIAIVALICSLINRAERVHGGAAFATDWVRTADGWESRAVLLPPMAPAPQVHPGLVAAFQVGASLFCLLAFPARAVATVPGARPAVRRGRPHPAPTAAAAS
jgi:hypothetical protein